MAKVKVVQVGQTSFRELEARTVSEAIKQYDSSMEGNYTVKVNNQESDMSTYLNEGDFVAIGDKVKGGSY